jgi:hypothetical protein
MIIEKTGNILKIDRGTANVMYIFREMLAAIRSDSSKNKIHLMTASYSRNSDFNVLPYSEITSPVFGSYSDFLDYILNFANSEVGEYAFTATSADAGSDSIDVSAYGWTSVSQVFVNNAFIPAADYSITSGTLSFDVNIGEGDVITIYA